MNPKVGARIIRHDTDIEFLTPFFFSRAFKKNQKIILFQEQTKNL